MVPLLLPFGTAVFSESPVLQAYLADRASGPIRDVAFSVYFTAAFGIGAFWAFVIGTIIAEFGYPVAFSVMAASYLAAAALLILIRERPATDATWRRPRGRRRRRACAWDSPRTRTSSRPGRSGSP